MHSLGSERSSVSFSGITFSSDVVDGSVDRGISDGSVDANQWKEPHLLQINISTEVIVQSIPGKFAPSLFGVYLLE